MPVVKGKGRFGPFMKWKNMFINDGEKYDWDNLSDNDIITLIEDKIQKEKDKLVKNWESEGIRIEKGKWGKHQIIKGKVKVELPSNVDVSTMTLDEAKAELEKKTTKKKSPTTK